MLSMIPFTSFAASLMDLASGSTSSGMSSRRPVFRLSMTAPAVKKAVIFKEAKWRQLYNFERYFGAGRPANVVHPMQAWRKKTQHSTLLWSPSFFAFLPATGLATFYPALQKCHWRGPGLRCVAALRTTFDPVWLRQFYDSMTIRYLGLVHNSHDWEFVLSLTKEIERLGQLRSRERATPCWRLSMCICSLKMSKV